MNDPLIEYLRRQLQPKGTAPLIEIGFLDGGMGGRAFFNVDFIQAAVEDMGKKLMVTQALGEPLSPLEKLAIDLLLASAYISKPEDRAPALARFTKVLQQEHADAE